MLSASEASVTLLLNPKTSHSELAITIILRWVGSQPINLFSLVFAFAKMGK
jgi:hypothetical protein